MKINNETLNLKHYLAIAAFLSGIIFGLIGIFCSPVGEVASSVLILIGQCFILSAGYIGMKIDIDKASGKFKVDQLGNAS